MLTSEHVEKVAFGEVSNSSASLVLLATVLDENGTDYHVYNRMLNISIHTPAVGGGGIIELRNTRGDIIKQWDADTVRDIPFDSGPYGMFLATSKGIEIIVHGGLTTQAGASINWSGYIYAGTRKDA